MGRLEATWASTIEALKKAGVDAPAFFRFLCFLKGGGVKPLSFRKC